MTRQTQTVPETGSGTGQLSTCGDRRAGPWHTCARSTMSDPSTMLETVLRRDRAIVAVGLVGIVVLAWLYLFHLGRTMAVEMAEMERHAVMGMAMPQMYG